MHNYSWFLGSGTTPIHIATSKGYESIVEFLLANGANVSATDEQKQTVLHHAISGNRNRLVELFIQQPRCSEILDVQDLEGRTPLFMSAQMDNTEASKIESLLICSVVMSFAIFDWNWSQVKLLLKAGAKLNFQDKTDGQTALLVAINRQNQEAIQMLLSFNASINTVQNDGQQASQCQQFPSSTSVHLFATSLIFTVSSLVHHEGQRNDRRSDTFLQTGHSYKGQFGKHSSNCISVSLQHLNLNVKVTSGSDTEDVWCGFHSLHSRSFTRSAQQWGKSSSLLCSSEDALCLSRDLQPSHYGLLTPLSLLFSVADKERDLCTVNSQTTRIFLELVAGESAIRQNAKDHGPSFDSSQSLPIHRCCRPKIRALKNPASNCIPTLPEPRWREKVLLHSLPR